MARWFRERLDKCRWDPLLKQEYTIASEAIDRLADAEQREADLQRNLHLAVNALEQIIDYGCAEDAQLARETLAEIGAPTLPERIAEES